MTRRRGQEEPAGEPGGSFPASSNGELKERVIHTRVPESLEVELRKRAQDLGISVSNLVRNVLGHAFGLVGDVVADSHAIARAARGGRGERDERDERGAPAAPLARAPGVRGQDDAIGARAVRPAGRADHDPAGATGAAVAGLAAGGAAAPPTDVTIDDVLAWQRIVLGKNAVCSRCNALMPRGHDAATGAAERGGTSFLICTTCLEELRS